MVRQPKRPWYRPTPKLLLHFLIVAAVMLGVSKITERLSDRKTFLDLSHQQDLAAAAVAGIIPTEIADRFLCAMMPSVALTNRQARDRFTSPRYDYLGREPLSHDCMYALSKAPPAPGAALPPPVVGHWAEGMNGVVMPLIAMFDTAWHVIVQPSLFASIFSIFAFAAGGLAAGMLMALPRFAWHPYVGATVFAIGTVAMACAVAFCLKQIMNAGLELFGGITHFAGFCCGASSMVVLTYQYVVKLIENGIHAGVDHVIPH